MHDTIIEQNGDTIEVHVHETGEYGEIIEVEIYEAGVLFATDINSVSINATSELEINYADGQIVKMDMSPFIRLMVGDIEILKKSGGDVTIIETGDIVKFFDGANGDAEVTGKVINGAVDPKTWDGGQLKYTNLQTYGINYPT